MAEVPCANVAWINIALFDADVRMVNSIYALHTSGAITHDDLQELATAMFVWHRFSVLPFLSSGIKEGGVTTVDLTPGLGDFAVAFAFPTPTGGFTGGHVPTNCGVRVDFRTLDTTKAGRGNNTVPGVPRSVVTNEQVDPDWYASIAAAYELVWENLPIHWQWVVLSRHLGGFDRAAGVTNEIIAVERHDPIIVSRRSRLRKSVH